MIKRFILLVILLVGTALTVLFSEGLGFFGGSATATATITATATLASTLTEEPTATTEFTVTEAPTTTIETTNTLQPTDTTESTETPTVAATATSTPTNTPTATATATSTESPITDLFKVQTGSPVFTVNFVHPNDGCNWQGVAGQVLSKTGAPLTNYILKITGTYNGVSVNQIGLSGLVTNEPYGPGSFEFILGTTAVDSQNMLTIQLFSPQAVEVMAPISINTYASCSKNLQIINFQQK